ncbi:hypothetical protein GQ43DRAFT_297849 [Delitschia confertaspora ATCC 74209]|uniref:Uncharacterized protein n=1 Tax=Delitschia confertaspora ATCC 74209 TaxID=1513339 RepID=A0A9P4JP34_9PLEO|nr:hypothetical protein GQ43DRAFT_297849 [Delitschia confertaspora ATCC 74209]
MAVSRRTLVVYTITTVSIILVFALSTTVRTTLTYSQPPRVVLQAQSPAIISIKESTQNANAINPTTQEYEDDSPRPIDITPGKPRNSSHHDEGYIGPKTTRTTSPLPPTPAPVTGTFPILALLYTGASGPKSCNGRPLPPLHLPPFAPQSLEYQHGACYTLTAKARCGLFIANKEDRCEAQLFNVPGCANTSRTFVNTVVFMPEERPVGAWWRSMWVRCGVEGGNEGGVIDPNLFQGLVHPKPGVDG